MKMYYITLNNHDEAKKISRILLEQQLAVCTNWFPITCMFRWQGEIKDEPEIVLVVKTQDGKRETIEKVIKSTITYTNYIAELDVHSVNEEFTQWLNAEVPAWQM